MHIPKFIAKIDDNHQYVVLEKYQKTFQQWLMGFKPGTFVSVVIKRDSVKRIRSLEANNYYWGVVIKYCCEAFGYELHEKEMVHEALKMKFLSQEHVIGLPISKSTTSLKSDEFWDYIETIRRWVSGTFGVYIPDPNEIDDIN